MTGPPAATPSTVSAQIREQQIPALKFRSDYVDVLENNKRVEVISQAEALRRVRIGGYVAVGNNTVKYLRRQAPELPVDGPVRNAVPRAQANFTTTQIGNLYEHVLSRRKGL